MRALGRGLRWVRVLERESAIGWDPVGGVVFLLHRITNTGAGSRKDTVARDIKGDVHELVHILKNHHVAVELGDTLEFYKREWLELACVNAS